MMLYTKPIIAMTCYKTGQADTTAYRGGILVLVLCHMLEILGNTGCNVHSLLGFTQEYDGILWV